jgi:hypothetical protein
MKTLIIGYADTGALDGGKLIAGPGLTTEAQTEQILADARDLHKFPEGIKRVEYFAVDQPQDIAIFISAGVAETVQNQFQAKLKLQEAADLAKQAEADKNKFAAAADKLFREAAAKRNAAVGAVGAQRNILAAETLPPKERDAVLKKIEALQPAADEAVKAFEAVLAARNVIRNPKSKPEDVEAALVSLGLKKATPNN